MHRSSYDKRGDGPTRQRGQQEERNTLVDAEPTISFNLLRTYYVPSTVFSALKSFLHLNAPEF